QRRIQGEVVARTRVGDLRFGDDTEDSGGIAVGVSGLIGSASGVAGGVEAGHIDLAGSRRGADLVRQRVVDAAAVIGALVIIPVALIDAAKLEQVVAVKNRDVVAKIIVVTIPETRADLLCVHVIGFQTL